MRVLLVNSNTSRSIAPAAPIGLAYVATATATRGHEVSFVDLAFARDPARRLRDAIERQRPDLVGVSVRNIDNVVAQRHENLIDGVGAHVDAIRCLTSAPIVLGGPAVSILGASVFDRLDADVAIAGEGEISFPSLADALSMNDRQRVVPTEPQRSGGEWRDLAGWCAGPSGQRADGEHEIVETPRGPRVFLRGTPAPASFGPSGLERWVDWAPWDRSGAAFPIQTKRGCALGCSYCTYPAVEGTESRMRKAKDVVDEIERVASLVGPRAFEFVDSTFNVPARHAVAICEEVLRRGLDVRLSTMGGNPLGIDLPLLALMKRTGFNSIMITPESASETMLARYRKGFGVRHVQDAADAVRASGLPSAWFFMLGGPGETPETVDETLRFVRQNLARADCLVVITTGVRVLPGSVLAREVGIGEGARFDSGYYVSPRIDEAAVLDAINRTIAVCPNVVHACEDGTSVLQRVAERALCALGQAPPYWRHMPRLLRLPPIPWLRARFPAAGLPVTGGA